MKRFVWRLQSVLDLKIQQEQLKRGELLRITQQLVRTQQQLMSRQRVLRDVAADIAQTPGSERLAQQEFFLRYSAASNRQIKLLKDQLDRLHDNQRQKMKELLQLQRSRRSLEKLKEHAAREFVAEQEKLQQKQLDEMAGLRFLQMTEHSPRIHHSLTGEIP